MLFHLGCKERKKNSKKIILLKANMLDISVHFVDQGIRLVPVGESLKHKAVLLREGF